MVQRASGNAKQMSRVLLSALSKSALLVLCGLLFHSTANAATVAERLYLVDAHSQVDSTIELETVLSLMDKAGVQCMILSAVATRSSREIVDFSSQHPDRIVPAVRMKRPAYNDNEPGYYGALKAEVETGDFKALSEVMMYHAQKGRRYPEIVVYPEDERVLTALRYALEKRWPFVVHIEFASPSIPDRAKFMQQFEAMLDRYPEHPFALAHMGQLNAAEVRRLIQAHPNVYFLTSRSNPVAANESREPWVNMFRGNVLSTEWKELVIRYPGRFLLAFDNVRPEHWGNFFLEEAHYWRSALAELPPDVAKAIAHGNAERLWRIAPH